MELRNIITFLRAAKLESFTKTAEELNYVQSTVTMQIRQLEAELGYPLFDRIGKKVFLSQKGKELLPYAEQIVQAMHNATQIKSPSSEVKGVLHLGILESLFTSVFSGLIPEFRERFPLVSIETKSDTTYALIQMLRKNELDIIFILDRNIVDKDFVKAFSRPEQIIFVTRPDRSFSDSAVVTLNDALNLPLILTEKRGGYRQALEQAAADIGRYVEPILQIDNTEIIIRQVLQGIGVSFLPRYTVQPFIDRGELSVYELSDFELTFNIQIIYHKNKWITPQMVGFIDLLCEYFKTH